jgi:hypothetical protein
VAARPVSVPASESSDAEPSGPTEPTEPTELAALRAERDSLRRRVREAEDIAEQLAEELGHARARLAAAGMPDADAGRLPLLDQTGLTPAPRSLADGGAASEGRGGPRSIARSADGSDPILLPIALAGTAAAVFLVALLSLANNGFLSLFSLGALLASGLLARAAWRTRVVPVEVWVEEGIVQVRRGDQALAFDLTNETTRLEVSGDTDDTHWRVRFYRRALDPFDVDATMVDPEEFMAVLRRYRSEL